VPVPVHHVREVSGATHDPLGFFELCLTNPIPSAASSSSATAPVGSYCVNPAELESTATFCSPNTAMHSWSASRTRGSTERSYGAVSVLSLSNTQALKPARFSARQSTQRMSGTSTCGMQSALLEVNAMPANRDTPATFTLCIAAPYEEEGAGEGAGSGDDAASASAAGPPAEAPARHRRAREPRATRAGRPRARATGAGTAETWSALLRAPHISASSPASVSAAIVAKGGAPSTDEMRTG
jgi:hypothetical protein